MAVFANSQRAHGHQKGAEDLSPCQPATVWWNVSILDTIHLALSWIYLTAVMVCRQFLSHTQQYSPNFWSVYKPS